MCSKSYETRSKFTRHLKQVHPEKLGDKKCHFCDFKSSHAQIMKTHVLQNHKDMCQNCNDCDQYFASTQELHNHNTKIHNKRFYECELCKTNFNRLQLFQNHQSDIHDLKLICDKCEYKARNNLILNKHIKRDHEKVQKYICNNM